ncbi:MAG: glycosyltransferase family 39 protein [Gemmatimonadaceae bacterium]
MAARNASRSRLVLVAVFAISAAYVSWHLRRGWIPHDDGALAQSAERVLQGELPHRDFDDLYTGGLSYLNAGAFRLFGTTLLSLRLALFAVFLAWVPAVYAIARRFLAPIAAGAVTLLAVVWSVPNYPGALPSWYNLFLATFGVAALFQHLDDSRGRWLLIAGAMGGLSFLAKVVGLYYVAGVLLFLVFHAHAHAQAQANARADARSGYGYALFVSAGLLVFVYALSSLVRHQLYLPEIVHFVVPGALIALLLARNEWTLQGASDRARFAALAALAVPFLAGVALPIAVFLIPYARAGALEAFVHGVFVLPMRRFGVAASPVLPLWTMAALGPGALLVAGLCRTRTPVRRREAALLALALAGLLLATASNERLYRAVWFSMRGLVPALTVASIMVLRHRRAVDDQRPLLRAQTMLLVSVTAMCSLVQFPFAVSIYFCYVAPLVVLTIVALSRYLPPTPMAVPAMLLAFYGAFAVMRANRSTLGWMGTMYRPYFSTQRMATPRGEIDIAAFQNKVYTRVIFLLRQHARGGYVWAGPDVPEVYFLTGLKNPTRSLFDFFDDSAGHTARVLRALDSHGVTTVVLNRHVGFSGPITAPLDAELIRRYPFAESVGYFVVRWRP